MKNAVIAILLIALVAVGAWCVNLQKQIKTQSAQLAQTENQPRCRANGVAAKEAKRSWTRNLPKPGRTFCKKR